MKRPKIEIYRAKDGHRWRLRAANGKILADSGEAYTRKSDAAKGCARTMQAMCVACVAMIEAARP